MPWVNLKPDNRGGGRKRQPPSAKLSAAGLLVLNHEAGDLLGNPAKVLVQVEPETCMFRMFPTTPDNTGGFSLSGGGATPPRIKITSATSQWPHLVGDYQVIRSAGGIELRKVTIME